jgi:hypothetical protein
MFGVVYFFQKTSNSLGKKSQFLAKIFTNHDIGPTAKKNRMFLLGNLSMRHTAEY